MRRLVFPLCLAALTISSASAFAAKDDSRPELISTTAGKGGENNWSSVEEMQKAADAGNPVANYSLGEMYLAGNGVERDVPKALSFLEKAADAGNANAAFRLGKLNADGEVVPKNLPEAVRRYQAAANAGVAEAQFNLGAMYSSGRGVKRDFVEGLAWLIVATKNGADPAGEKQLREHLTKGKRASVIAAAEQRAAALAKEIAAGKTTSSGEPATGSATDASSGAGPGAAPVATRPDGKVKLDAPVVPGRIQISPPINGGLGMPAIPPPKPLAPEPPPASGPEVKLVSPLGRPGHWAHLSDLEHAAEQGDAAAFSDLGQILLAGKLVPADPERAALMLERGAAAGSPDAAYQLAELTMSGVHQVRDDTKALALYRQAAKGGSAIAMFNVGAFLANGKGAPRDYTEALAWVLVAKKHGVERPDVEGRIRAHLQKTSPAQIEAAETRASALDQEIASASKNQN